MALGYWNARKRPRRARLSGGQLEQILAGPGHAAGVDLVVGMAHQRVGQAGLARSVGAHQGVNLALAHREGEALEDLLAGDADPKVLDLELVAHARSVLLLVSCWWRPVEPRLWIVAWFPRRGERGVGGGAAAADHGRVGRSAGGDRHLGQGGRRRACRSATHGRAGRPRARCSPAADRRPRGCPRRRRASPGPAHPGLAPRRPG